jgi:hypothetical protein
MFNLARETPQLRLKARIVPTGQNLPWAEARKAVKDKGGLPSHPLLDDCLMRSDDWRSIRSAFPLWSSQVLVYPAVGGVFKRGENITDTDSGLVFPAEHIPDSAFDTPKTGLLVLPGELNPVAGGLLAIEQPVSVLVVHDLVEQNGGLGRVHEKSRLPLEVPQEEAQLLAFEKKRFLWRKGNAGIGSVACYFYVVNRRNVNAVVVWSDVSGVAYVAYDILDGTATLAKGVPLADMQKLAAGATGSDLSEALRALPAETLEAARRLAQQQAY